MAVAGGACAGALAVQAPWVLLLAAGAAAVLGATYLVLDRLDIGVTLIVAAMSLDVAGRITSDPFPVTVFQVLLLLCLLAWGVRGFRSSGWRLHAPSWLAVALMGLLFAAAWSLPFSLDRRATLIAGGRLLFLALLTVLVARVTADEPTHRRVLVVLVGSATAMSTVALVQRVAPGFASLSDSQLTGAGGVIVRHSALFHDPNYFAGFLSVGIVVALACALHARSWRSKTAWLASVPLMSAALVGTMSRTGWTALLAGLAALVLTTPTRSRRTVALAFVSALLLAAVFMPASVTNRVASVLDPMADRSLRTRVLMLDSTFDMIADHWVFGVGLGAFEDAYPRYFQAGASLNILSPHQVPVAIFAEMGIAGLLAELGLTGVVSWAILRRRRRWDATSSASVSGLVVLATGALFQSYLYFEYVWLFVALVVATAVRTVDREVCHA